MEDIVLFAEKNHGETASQTKSYQVASGTSASIQPGTPVLKSLGSQYVAAATDGMPVVATDFFVGIAASASTETASAAGTVEVYPLLQEQVWLIAPKAPTSFDTQTEYNGRVGDRYVLDLTTGTWTIDSTDGATNGCVVRDLNIADHPGKVAFSFRNGVSWLT